MNITVEITSNRKTGPVSATYAPQQTCPKDCRFLGTGCYANNNPCGIHFARITRQAVGKSLIAIARDEADKISDLTGRYPLRLHVSGDCSTPQCAREIAESCWNFTLKHGCPVWAYTHAWRKIPREAWGRISIFASCETIEDVQKAITRAYAPALVVPKLPTKCIDLGYGLTGIPCTEQSRGTPCVSCRLCFRATKLLQRGQVVLFEPHGALAQKAKEVLI